MSIYNNEKSLKGSIESVINQSFKDFEFIIVNDASTDKSLEILETYAKIDNRVKVIKNHVNLGLTKSLNKALRISRGEFIARQDGDDILLPNHLEKLINFLKKNPDYAFCGCNGFQIQNNRELVIYFEFNDIKRNLIAINCFNHSGTVIRRNIFKNCGYYNEKYRYGQDYELWCRLIYKYQLKAANLREKLIIRNMPDSRLFNKNIYKFFIQENNSIKTKFKYIKFSRYKFKGFISILVKFIGILTFSHVLNKFTNSLNKINF